MKRNLLSSIFLLTLLFFPLFNLASFAIELDEATRTVTFDKTGKMVTLTPEQVQHVEDKLNNRPRAKLNFKTQCH